MESKSAVKGAARRYAPAQRLMVSAAAVFALVLLQCPTADAAPNTGSAGSDLRKAYCKGKLDACNADTWDACQAKHPGNVDAQLQCLHDDDGCEALWGTLCVHATDAPAIKGTGTTRLPGLKQVSPPKLTTKVPSGGVLQQQ
jgi:hypothetical protein